MRGILFLSVVAFLYPAAAMAQGAAAPPANPPAAATNPPAAASEPPGAPAARRGGRDITRDEYIERAKQNAAKRFDKFDTNHDGVLTIDERRAARAARSKRQQPSEPQ
jgi:hypothetical protein